MLRRFTRLHVQHPPYKALVELGKARRTIFLCRYLRLPEWRRAIHEGLKVVDNWNSAHDCMLSGNGGEIATNRREDQEWAMLALHLFQNAMVDSNTLMRQRVLSEEAWMQRMTVDDLRALTPLISSHISPYGTFLLDMHCRLDLDQPVEAVHTGTAQVTAKTIRKSAHVPRSASAETQQLPLFNETP